MQTWSFTAAEGVGCPTALVVGSSRNAVLAGGCISKPERNLCEMLQFSHCKNKQKNIVTHVLVHTKLLSFLVYLRTRAPELLLLSPFLC